MSTDDAEIRAYNQALVTALRQANPASLRQLASIWGERLGNRGLKALAKATDETVERRMWMMIYDRPDLADLHERAEEWFDEHPDNPPE